MAIMTSWMEQHEQTVVREQEQLNDTVRISVPEPEPEPEKKPEPMQEPVQVPEPESVVVSRAIKDKLFSKRMLEMNTDEVCNWMLCTLALPRQSVEPLVRLLRPMLVDGEMIAHLTAEQLNEELQLTDEAQRTSFFNTVLRKLRTDSDDVWCSSAAFVPSTQHSVETCYSLRHRLDGWPNARHGDLFDRGQGIVFCSCDLDDPEVQALEEALAEHTIASSSVLSSMTKASICVCVLGRAHLQGWELLRHVLKAQERQVPTVSLFTGVTPSAFEMQLLGPLPAHTCVNTLVRFLKRNPQQELHDTVASLPTLEQIAGDSDGFPLTCSLLPQRTSTREIGPAPFVPWPAKMSVESHSAMSTAGIRRTSDSSALRDNTTKLRESLEKSAELDNETLKALEACGIDIDDL